METYKSEIATNPKVELIHISRDQNEDAAEEWARELGFPWPTILPDDMQRTGLDKYYGGGVPTYVMVDKDGNEVAKGLAAALQKARELAAN